ncbi:diadenylate cyclase [uncultured Jatrophihabitans sp.]|uniref:diadenylate cyclase n=1 Tax=uncultured Jatrophihabitans sp. TaxID=1610747 RepID=UPI0035CB9278
MTIYKAGKVSDRRDRLRDELREANAALLELEHVRTGGDRSNAAISAHLAIRDRLEEVLLEEVLYARYTPVHERRRSTYGAIVFESGPPEDMADTLHLVPLGPGAALEDLRSLANGMTSFVVRTLDTTLGIGLVPAPAREQTLVDLAINLNCDVVQRHPSGAVRVFGRERLLIHEFDTWRRAPYGHTRWLSLGESVAADSRTAGAVVDLAMHVLSAQQVGATLVLMLRGTTSDLGPRLSSAPRALPVDLNVTNVEHAQLLATALAAVDGACLIETDGAVSGIEAMFMPTDKAKKAINLPKRGARHHSAARLSFDVPEALAFVVSADGAVSVFSDGRSILNLDPFRSEADSMAKLAGRENADKISEGIARLSCPACGKRLVVTVTTIDGWKDRETLDCPVCETNAIYAKNCWEISARVLKPWEA